MRTQAKKRVTTQRVIPALESAGISDQGSPLTLALLSVDLQFSFVTTNTSSMPVWRVIERLAEFL